MVYVDWDTRIIHYPQVSSVDVEQFRNDMRVLEETYEGMQQPPIVAPAQGNYTAPGLGGVAITVQIINGYRLQFEDAPYEVTIQGGNLLGDIVNNQVNVTRILSQAYVVGGAMGAMTAEQDERLKAIEALMRADEVKQANGTVTKYREGTEEVLLEKDFVANCDSGEASLKKKST